MNTNYFIPKTNVDNALLDAVIGNFYDWNDKIASVEYEGKNGCFLVSEINNVIYIDSELYGKVNSRDNIETVNKILS